LIFSQNKLSRIPLINHFAFSDPFMKAHVLARSLNLITAINKASTERQLITLGQKIPNIHIFGHIKGLSLDF
jgi:hypothetical protein